MSVNLEQLQQFLDRCLAVDQFEADQGGIYHPSLRPIQRIGLALEPAPQLAEWVRHHQLDALFLHRPWRLPPDLLPADVGVLWYHQAFDERLTLGLNPRLAIALTLSAIEPLGKKADRTIGMMGTLPTQSFEGYCHQLNEIFAGFDQIIAPSDPPISRVAVMGAMTDALVREAAQRGAEVYVTGQFRQPGAIAVQETGIGVVAVGHRRSEIWGLRALAGLLRERWAGLEVHVFPF